MSARISTLVLLVLSNCFMTFAWYGHLKYRSHPLWQAIFLSWLLAFFEYVLQVPANRIGYGIFTAAQLKIMQEAITLTVFAVFSYFYLHEALDWRNVVSFGLIIAAVCVTFWK